MRSPNPRTMVLRSDTAQVLRKGDGKPFNKRQKMAPRTVRKDRRRKIYFQFDSDILWDILFRLPIEALLLCRCVCKTWYNAIQNPAFISMHMNISSKQPPRFICQFTAWECTLREESSFNENNLLLCDTEDGKTRKMPLGEKSNKFRRIFFSHNGLLCIATKSCLRGDSVVICNPITKERIELPPITKKDVKIYGVGFCFVPERQKHIVVQALYSSSRDLDEPIKFYILTSGQRSWRLLTSPPSINGWVYTLVGDTVYWNNAFHWHARKAVGELDSVCILSFDTIRETFQIISFPNAHHGRGLQLLVLNGRLSFIEIHGEKMKVWEVTGDKVGEFSLVCRETYDCDFGTKHFSLVSRLPKNRSLLVRFYPCLFPSVSGFVVASNDMKQYEDLNINGLPRNFYVSSYSPSLVSVHSMGFS